MNIRSFYILVMVLLFVACRKTDDDNLATCVPDSAICLADIPLTIYFDESFRFIDPNYYQHLFITDLEGQLVSCRPLTSTVNQYTLDRPCGKFHLHLASQICAGDPPCEQIDITTYTDLDTESWYFKSFQTTTPVYKDTLPARISLEQCYTGLSFIGPNQPGRIILQEPGCSNAISFRSFRFEEDTDIFFAAYRDVNTTPAWNYRLFENLSGQTELDIFEEDFPSNLPPNLKVEYPADATTIIVDIQARAIINNNYHFWDIFPFNTVDFSINESPDMVPNPVGLFPHFITHFRQKSNGISYLRSQLAEDIDVAYFPEPFDLEFAPEAWNKFRVKKTAGAASSERFRLSLSAAHCNQVLTWNIYGASEQDIHFTQCLPDCLVQSMPMELMDQLSPSVLRSIHETEYPTYEEWIQTFTDPNLPRADWHFTESSNLRLTVEPGTELPNLTREYRDQPLE